MKLEKGELSNTQLMFLIVGFIQGSLLVITYAGEIAKHDLWISLITAFLMSIPLVVVYLKISLKFPGKNLIEINDLIFGPYLGKFISFQYIILFLSIASASIWFVGDFLISFFFPETPILAVIIMFVFICAWAVRAGIEVIARMSFLLTLITLLIVLITTVLLLKDMKLTNFLPVFELPIYNYIQSTHILMSIPFMEVFVFVMVIPYVNKIKQVKTSALLGLLVGGITYLIVVIRNALVLGSLEEILISPSVEAVRMIDIGRILDRLEVLVAIILVVTIFLKVSVFYYATVLGIAQLLNLRSYIPLVIPVGIIGISIAMSNKSAMQFSYTVQNTYPMFCFPFYVVLPILSLFVAKIRKIPKQKERNAP